MIRFLLVAWLGFMASSFLTACSSITILRTAEIKAVGDTIRTDVRYLQNEVDSLQGVIDSLLAEQTRFSNRLRADLATLNMRVVEEAENDQARMEELLYRLDLLMNKSEKILSKRVVVSKKESEPLDSSSVEAQQISEMTSLYNTARTDYHRGEFRLAYGAFKQVYETIKNGELAENALYWMALCMQDAGQKENSQKLFLRVLEQFPEGAKTCVVLYKLAAMSDASGEVELQKQYLQRLLSLRKCAETNEFLKGAQQLQDLLANPQDSSKMVSSSSSMNASSSSQTISQPSSQTNP